MTPEELAKAFRKSPSVEKYLQLRRKYPKLEFDMGLLASLDHLFFINTELEKYGVDGTLVANVLEGSRQATSELSLLLLQKLVSREALKRRGDKQIGRKIISDQLVDWLIAMTLDVMSRKDRLNLPRDLLVLIRHRLVGSSPGYEKGWEVYVGRKQALHFAAQLIAKGKRVSIRLVAKEFLVEPSTVSRWFPKGDLIERAEMLARRYKTPSAP